MEGGTTTERGGFITSNSIFGGDTRQLSGQEFTGANITTAFGGCELDFTGFEDARDGSRIHFTVAFGGAEIFVPTSWKIERQGLTCVFGGIDIKGNPSPDAVKTVELSGICAFGGIDVIYR